MEPSQIQDWWQIVKIIGIVEIICGIAITWGLRQVRKDSERYITMVSKTETAFVDELLALFDAAKEIAGVKKEDVDTALIIIPRSTEDPIARFRDDHSPEPGAPGGAPPQP